MTRNQISVTPRRERNQKNIVPNETSSRQRNELQHDRVEVEGPEAQPYRTQGRLPFARKWKGRGRNHTNHGQDSRRCPTTGVVVVRSGKEVAWKRVDVEGPVAQPQRYNVVTIQSNAEGPEAQPHEHRARFSSLPNDGSGQDSGIRLATWVKRRSAFLQSTCTVVSTDAARRDEVSEASHP